MDLASKMIKCKDQIEKNNQMLVKITKENLRLHRSLVAMINQVDAVKMERYKKELSGDSYKLTEYWKKRKNKN